MSDRKGDGILGVLGLCILIGLMCTVGGPVALADKAKGSGWEKVFIWIFIRSFWFGVGALTVYLFIRN